MEKTREANLCLNYDKITVKQPSVIIFGNIYSAENVKAAPYKVKAITEMRPPETKGEVKSFFGHGKLPPKIYAEAFRTYEIVEKLREEGSTFLMQHRTPEFV